VFVFSLSDLAVGPVGGIDTALDLGADAKDAMLEAELLLRRVEKLPWLQTLGAVSSGFWVGSHHGSV
jgi:hypothetical protein